MPTSHVSLSFHLHMSMSFLPHPSKRHKRPSKCPYSASLSVRVSTSYPRPQVLHATPSSPCLSSLLSRPSILLLCLLSCHSKIRVLSHRVVVAAAGHLVRTRGEVHARDALVEE
ncbi:unnamed protein product, partial [Ectocarpus fasciculatus]